MIKSHTLIFSDFETKWYKKWAKELKQDKNHLDNHDLLANKFWQNAIIVEALTERLDFTNGVNGIGFGVGQERVPALLAKLGANVTASDQDFSTSKAKHWQQHELAQDAQSLNRLRICDPKIFSASVDYRAIDMTRIPKSVHGKYDFVWSNCALGHLGSIEAGLKFIEDSLDCLKPGGWAVHTTEFNVLSNTKTSEGGDTVIFRAKDIQAFYKSLSRRGYICEPLILTFGKSAKDARISMRPTFGNDFSKIQVNGHLATQAVLLIHKPLDVIATRTKPKVNTQLNRHTLSYVKNLATLATYKRRNKVLQSILDSQRASLRSVHIKPQKKELSVMLKRGQEKQIFIQYQSNSKHPLFGLYSRLADSNPIVLGTSSPNDRASLFANPSWSGKDSNRPSFDIQLVRGKKIEPADYVRTGDTFGFYVNLSAKNLKQGKYAEDFALVQELKGWIPGTTVTVHVDVI